MNLDFTDEQYELRDAVRKFLSNEHPVGQARDNIDGKKLYSQAVWKGLADMGVTALMLPESCGGHGMGALELCVVAEEIGRQNACVPLISSLYLATQAVLDKLLDDAGTLTTLRCRNAHKYMGLSLALTRGDRTHTVIEFGDIARPAW